MTPFLVGQLMGSLGVILLLFCQRCRRSGYLLLGGGLTIVWSQITLDALKDFF